MKQLPKIYDHTSKAKEELIQLNENYNESELSSKVGITESERILSQESFTANSESKLTPEQEYIADLEKKLKDSEFERDILKKAIIIFSNMVDDLCLNKREQLMKFSKKEDDA